jgi:hypothetical protein
MKRLGFVGFAALSVACTGPQGPKGEAGGAGGIVASIYCGGPLENTSLSFSYNAYLFADQSVFASAAIQDAAIGSSYANFYAPSQNGAQTAAVSLVFDVAGPANGGWWTIRLDRTTLITTIEYKDGDTPNGGAAWTMAPSSCVSNTY